METQAHLIKIFHQVFIESLANSISKKITCHPAGTQALLKKKKKRGGRGEQREREEKNGRKKNQSYYYHKIKKIVHIQTVGGGQIKLLEM